MGKATRLSNIEDRIYQIRGKRVMLDEDLARLYGVETYQLTRQVRRNLERFPDDFMFTVTKNEYLSCQIGSSKRGGRRYLPYAFTQEGIAMLSSVLSSERAIQVNIHIMRAFVSMRRIAVTYVGLKRQIDDMERRYDAKFGIVFKAIRRLLSPQEKPRRLIGFRVR